MFVILSEYFELLQGKSEVPHFVFSTIHGVTALSGGG